MAKNKSDNSDSTPYETDQDVRDAHYFEDGVDEDGVAPESSEKED